jgi:hypothetical protein
VIALIVAGVVVLAAAGVALFLLLGINDDTTAASGPTTPSRSEATSSSSQATAPSSSPPAGGDEIPAATVTPDGLGEDPLLDQYAQSCYDGDMQACDDLYAQSEADSPYETYGGTCAGRQDLSISDTVYCTDAFPAA